MYTVQLILDDIGFFFDKNVIFLIGRVILSAFDSWCNRARELLHIVLQQSPLELQVLQGWLEFWPSFQHLKRVETFWSA